jgi:hypothetical protein
MAHRSVGNPVWFAPFWKVRRWRHLDGPQSRAMTSLGVECDYRGRPALCRAVQRLCGAVVPLPVLPVADRARQRARPGKRRAAQSAAEEEGANRAGGRGRAVGRLLCPDRLWLARIVKIPTGASYEKNLRSGSGASGWLEFVKE